MSIFSRTYWSEAVKSFSKTKMLVYAALICSLRIVVKALRIPVLPGGLTVSFDGYVNALGSLVYGPVVGLAVGAISDTIGAILFPSGTYFFPFIFVEMSSSFIFGLFLWRRKITTHWVILARFTVSFFCNVILTSLVMKWMYAALDIEKTYYFINTARIVKNLVLFPLEGVLIALIINAFIPALKRFRFVDEQQMGIRLRKKDVLLVILLTAIAVGLVLLYVFVLKDFLQANNWKFW
ncbi:MAG: folate family ECF transporter S component [Clostridia bacterium]|nr:folate family ECF transporter S component [Clostridia bacterium]